MRLVRGIMTANMKYRKNIKNDNKNIESICYAKSSRSAEYSHGKQKKTQTKHKVNEKRKKSNAQRLFFRLIILLMHEIVCTIDDVQ